MKTNKNIIIHDELEEKFNTMMKLMADSGAKITLRDSILSTLLFICMFLYSYLDFQYKSPLALLPLLFLSIIIVVYYKMASSQTARPYMDMLHCIPSNYNAFSTFSSKCTETFSKEELLLLRDYLELKMNNYTANAIISTAVLTVISTVILNSMPSISNLIDGDINSTKIYYLLQGTTVFCGIYLILTTKKHNLQKLSFYLGKIILQQK